MEADGSPRTVGDYVTLIRGTTYKGQLVGKAGPALLGLGSIVPGGGFRIGDYKTYGGECPPELMLFPGDIYVSLKGATKDGKMIGSVARVPEAVTTGRLTQDTVKLVFRTPNAGDASFLYWILRTPQYRDYCAGHAMGSAVVALSRRDFLSYPIPPLTPARRRLVAVLDAIEKKTELNGRISHTLDAVARVLFKSWFVDFDPVRAKMEGRDPGLPKEIADLFPRRMVESELGAIPEGWEVARLDDIAEILRDSENPLEFPEVLFRHFSIPAFDEGQWPREERGDNIKSLKSRVRPDTVLLSKLNPEIPRVWLPDVQVGERAICSTEFLVLRPRIPVGRAFVYSLLRSRPFRQAIEGLVTGTSKSHQRVQAAALLNLVVIPPPRRLSHEFERVVGSLLERILNLRRESRSLAALRDVLLPKLISGQIRVPAARMQVEEALA